MKYSKRADLPEDVQRALRDVPHALDIYKEAFNSAWERYEAPAEREDGRDREQTAHAVAWSAVKHGYEKNENGDWRKKAE